MKSQILTDEIKKAIWDWYQEEKLTQPQIAKLLGLKHASVNAWLNGDAKTIRPKNWEKLYPHIKNYLPSGYITNGVSSPIVTGAHAIGINNGTITQNCLDSVIGKIIADEELSDAEKVKFIRVLRK